jgi:hypothetical protein
VRSRLLLAFLEVQACARRVVVALRVAPRVAVELPEQVARERAGARMRARAWVRAGKGFR